jgi:chemotaxis protein histidine kinase CheA
MVTQLLGTIGVESVVGDFTRFVMTLPNQQTFLRLNQEGSVGVSP